MSVAIVTGASSGIGRATALAFAQAGFDVGLTFHRGAGRAAAVAERIEQLGRAAAVRRLDLSRPEDAAGAVGDLVAALGGLDVLVLNAGVNRRAELAEETVAGFSETLAVDLVGPWACARAAVPHMAAGAAIVAVTSVLAHAPLTGGGAYCAAKAGLAALARVLALELAPRGIAVNAVAPGHTATPMNFAEPVDAFATARPVIPAGRPADAAEVAGAVVFLATAPYVTGADLVVDGGLLAVSGPETLQRATGLPERR